MKSLIRHWPAFMAAALCLGLGLGCTKASKARRVLSAAERDYKAQKFDAAEIEYQTVLALSRLNPIAIRRLGCIYSEEGRTLDALTYLTKANEQDPQNGEVQLKLAEIHSTGPSASRGILLLDSLLRAEPTNGAAILLMAQMCSNQDIPNFRQRMQTTLRQAPKSAAVIHTALGFVDMRQDKTNDADLEFQKATALDPNLPGAYQGHALICFLRKDTKGIEQALKMAADLSPIRSAARLKYADFRTQAGDTEGAKKIMQDIADKAPDYVPAWLYLMKIAFAERRFDDCKQAIDRILSRDTLNYDALLESGILSLSQQDVSKAKNTFLHMDAIYKNVKEIKYYLAVTDLLNNEKQKATDELTEALALDHDYSMAVLLLAQIHFRSGHLSEAIRLLSQLVKDHPENAKAHLALADAYMAQGHPEQSLEVYRQMEPMFPKEPEIPLRIAILYEGQANFRQARISLEKALSMAPDNLHVVERLTDLDVQEQRYAEAHHRVTAMLEKNPKAAEPFVLQGEIYVAEKRTNNAEEAYSKAIELDPELASAYLNLARLYVDAHEDQAALKRLDTLAVKTNEVAMLMIGEIHQAAGRYENARESYEKLLALRPRNFLALNNLAYVDSEYLGQIDRAYQLALTARQIKPYDPYTADTLGWILYKKHEYAHAVSLIQESLEKRPDPEVTMHLGMGYYMMEEEKPARFYLQRALASTADFPGKQLVRRRLDVLDIDPVKATPAIVQELQSLIHENPLDPVPLIRLASVQEQRGDADAAIESLQNLLSINDQVWPAMIHLSGLYADKKHDLRKALELAKQAHVLAPNEASACVALGDLIYRSGADYPWALSLLQQAANQQSDTPSLDYGLAMAYYAVGRVNQADTAMQMAARRDEGMPFAQKAKDFLALRAAGRNPAQAEASAGLVKDTLAKDPNNVPALMVSALLAERHNQRDEAAQIYNKVLSIYPIFAPAMRQLAILYSQSDRKSDLNKAYDLAERARAALPDDAEVAKTVGLLAYRRADYNRSMLVLREIDGKSGNDGELSYYLGMDYYNLQQRRECKLALQRALDLRVSDALAAQARRVLKELN